MILVAIHEYSPSFIVRKYKRKRWDEELRQLDSYFEQVFMNIISEYNESQMNAIFHWILYYIKIYPNYTSSKIFYEGLVQSQISYGFIRYSSTYQNDMKTIGGSSKVDAENHEIFELAELLDIRHLYASRVLPNIMSKKITMNSFKHDYTTRIKDHSHQTLRCMKTICHRCNNNPKIHNFFQKNWKI